MGNPVALGPLSIDPPKPYVQPRVRKQDVPAWMVGGKGFFDDKDKLWSPGQALYFDGVPNIDLIPLNKLAYDRMQAWLDVQDAQEEKQCKKNGKLFVKKPRAEWTDDGVVNDLPTPDAVMAARKQGENEAIR